jgi:cellulose synthase/poly-beta-1,6-N-acetylglucosamine synthase-like glycosyltransferase
VNPLSSTETARQVARDLAAKAGLTFVTLDPAGSAPGEHQQTNPLAARLLSEQVCRHFTMLPISYADGIVTIAIADPPDNVAHDIAHSLTGREIVFAIAPRDEILWAIDDSFGGWGGEEGRDETFAGPGPVTHPAYPTRLGDLLVARGYATDDDIAFGLDEQARTGSRLGDILVSFGVISQDHLVSVLAEQFQLPVAELSDYEPDPAALDLIPEPLSRHLRVVPLAVDETTLYVAVSDVLDDATVEELRRYTHLELRGFLASRNSIDELLQHVHGGEYVAVAKSELLSRFPEESAAVVFTGMQRTSVVLILLVLAVCLVLWTHVTAVVVMAICAVFYLTTSLYKFVLTNDALGHTYEIDVAHDEVALYDERKLPVYSILVPLYKEAGIIHRLVSGIGELNYPKTKLDVRLLCEEDDEETIETILAMELPPYFKLVVVPDAQPKTKPKACNYGLLQADGKYVVIYDAEDRPDPDQLKKVVIAFEKSDPAVTCIQAKLNYFNSDQNLLTRWFTIEYSMWFDLMLPGLDAQQAPIPLGGTSNHFITDRLIELAAWDPYNVTEDADLGIRLARAGWKTAMIDSTTYEEANSRLQNWINQRSRWIKGYIQTWLVHMRNPVKLLGQLGLKNFFSFQMIVGGTFIFLLNPIFWLLTTLFLITQAGWIQDLFPPLVFYLAAFQLFIGNFIFMYLNVAGCVQRGYFELAKFALLSPLYWGLMSWAAWKGFLQLFTNPFYWEKTEHGLDMGHGGGTHTPVGSGHAASQPPARATSANARTGEIA